MKIKVLYLHNDNSLALSQEEINILTGFNFDTYSPIINYLEHDYLYYKNLYNSFKPDFIIGVGAGGRVAYWLSNVFNTKALLINPYIGISKYDNFPIIPDYFKPTRYSDQVFVFAGSSKIVKRKEILKYTGNAFREITIDEMDDNFNMKYLKRGILEAVNYIL